MASIPVLSTNFKWLNQLYHSSNRGLHFPLPNRSQDPLYSNFVGAEKGPTPLVLHSLPKQFRLLKILTTLTSSFLTAGTLQPWVCFGLHTPPTHTHPILCFRLEGKGGRKKSQQSICCYKLKRGKTANKLVWKPGES